MRNQTSNGLAWCLEWIDNSTAERLTPVLNVCPSLSQTFQRHFNNFSKDKISNKEAICQLWHVSPQRGLWRIPTEINSCPFCLPLSVVKKVPLCRFRFHLSTLSSVRKSILFPFSSTNLDQRGKRFIREAQILLFPATSPSSSGSWGR